MELAKIFSINTIWILLLVVIIQATISSASSCSVDNGGCDINCEETPAGAQCSCPKGFIPRLDGQTCEDIDECEVENGGCQHNCHNSYGSYRCNCNKGYKLHVDEKECEDINECELNYTCSHMCTNTVGSFTCSCRDGFMKYATGRCGDIDECAFNNGGCEHSCENSIGSFKCSCNSGYYLHWNERDCIRKSTCPTTSKRGNGLLTCSARSKWCSLRCTGGQYFTSTKTSYFYTCGTYLSRNDRTPQRTSTYPWITRYSHSVRADRGCDASLPRIHKVRAKLTAKQCSLGLGNPSATPRGSEEYQILGVSITCDALKKKKPRSAVTFEVELLLHIRGKCDAKCATRKLTRITKTITKTIKKSVSKNSFFLRFPDTDLYLGKKKGIITGTRCKLGEVPRGDSSCEACGPGTKYDAETFSCVNCSAGFYQNNPGQLNCLPCPEGSSEVIDTGDETQSRLPISATQCPGACRPGHYSATGMEPCIPCPANEYQPYYGRIGCYECDTRLSGTITGSSSFANCSVRVRCPEGHYYDVRVATCKRCPVGYYQPLRGENFCYKCPGETNTDFDASSDVEACKDTTCGGEVSNDFQGYIESPNYPGNYPINARCQWNIIPPKGRKILLVVPEIHLHGEDTCGDRLVMRRSQIEKSTLTYETCQTFENPVALTARSKRLYVEFTSDGQNTAKGFRIPYVTYDENYEEIIKDIVKDSKLYSSSHHQDILQDEKSRTTLFDVLAHPEKYFILRKQNFRGLFRQSFIVFLKDKVITFLNPTGSKWRQ